MKRTIEIEDTLNELIEHVTERTKELLIDYLNDNIDTEEAPCLSNDIDYDGRFHEMIDSSAPVYTSEVKDLFYLHGSELEQSFDNAGIGKKDDDWPMGWRAAAIYCHLEEKAAEWYSDNVQDAFEEWARNKVSENAVLLINSAHGRYIPQIFASDFSEKWNVSKDDLSEIKSEKNAYYWDSWQSILDDAEYTDSEGVEYSLYQDGDLWAIPTNIAHLVEYWAS